MRTVCEAAGRRGPDDHEKAQTTMSEKPASNSSGQDLSIVAKASEWWSLLAYRLRGNTSEFDLGLLFDSLTEYDTYLQKYSNTTLQDAAILEIGFGARPNRLIAMMSLGLDAIGVDLDQPLLHRRVSDFREIYKKNGFERLLKTLVRSTFFDASERRALKRSIREHGGTPTVNDNRFVVADASSEGFDERMRAQPVDLITSEDVFEHIPTDSLRLVVARMGQWLKPHGIALIRPNIFTGIAGGHLVEWYFPVTADRDRKSEPWEHLRKRRFQANTFLNELTLAEYRELFAEHFEILEERVLFVDAGREFATPEVLEELREYPEEELFSNRVLFVLRPR
jgi:SAM-dependent methyltransferase